MAPSTRTRPKKAKRSPKAQRSRRRAKTPPNNHLQFQALREWFLPDGSIFSQLRLHGNTKWMPLHLVWLAFCWAWCDARFVTDAFAEAVRVSQTLFGVAPLTTYQGFMGALVTWTPRFLPLLWAVLQRRMEQIGGKFWRIDGWVPLGFDGSRSTAPRTKANEAALCAPTYGRGKTAQYRKKKSKGLRRKKNQKAKPQPPQPQAWITLMWHMGLRLPWCWRLGPSNASERQHVLDMVAMGSFPKHTLFCGDAGFVGYPLWSQLLACGADFLVRVGANVRLLTEQAHCVLEKTGKQFRVYCWPQEAQKEGQPPLRLRLVSVQVGRIRMWMLTSVLEGQRLTNRAIARFYQMRWGIEVEFRGLKQTLNHAKLRCRDDKRLLMELHWSILAMALAELLALKEQLDRKRRKAAEGVGTSPPAKRSLAQTMRVLRRCLRDLQGVPAPGKDLASGLREAITDSYQRKASKRARYRPPNPDKKPLGDPKLRRLTRQEKQGLKRLRAEKTG